MFFMLEKDKKIIQKMMDFFGVSKMEEVAVILGYSPSTINTWHTKGITKSVLKRFELISSKKLDNQIMKEKHKITQTTPQHTIKYYPNIRVSAGYGIANFEEEFELIDATFLNTFNLANVKNLEMVQVQGDSMLPYIEDGEFIILERKSDFKNGEIIVFNLNDNIYIKQALRIPNQNKISCISKNPLFPSFDIEGDDLNKMQLIGILRAKIKRF